MGAGQGKPYTITSTNPKMSCPGGIKSYEKGGLVTAGAGRGGQGGPTAKQLADHERRENRGIYTAEMGEPPDEPDMMTSLTPAQRKAAQAKRSN